MAFSTRTRINGEELQLWGDTAGSLRMSSRYANGDLTVSFSSSKDLTVNGRGDLDATINGGNENDTFNFLQATGNYTFNTGGGNDTVIDGTGNNTFNGAAGLDTFVFRAEGGTTETDYIDNYVLADDTIRIAEGSVTSVAASGTDVTITLSDGDHIVVRNSGYTAAQIQGDIVLGMV